MIPQNITDGHNMNLYYPQIIQEISLILCWMILRKKLSSGISIEEKNSKTWLLWSELIRFWQWTIFPNLYQWLLFCSCNYCAAFLCLWESPSSIWDVKVCLAFMSCFERKSSQNNNKQAGCSFANLRVVQCHRKLARVCFSFSIEHFADFFWV